MNSYDLSRLDSRKFENLCADIIEKETRLRVERFTVGKDGGIDGRFWIGDDKNVIIQAKHYPDVKPTGIISALQKEIKKVQTLKPERYIFMTSGKLTPTTKSKMQTEMDGFIKNPTDIWGFDEIQSFLSKEENFDIVKKYAQLYIYSETLLKKILGDAIAASLIGGSHEQGNFLLENIKKNSSRFVFTEDYHRALEFLDTKNVVVITGEAGIGKSTLSNMLAFFYVKSGYTFYLIRSIKEAEDVVFANPKKDVVLYFDDFLGESFMDISKGDDSSQIVLFIERVKRSKRLKFILNSRTTIINKAHNIFPSLEKGNIKTSEYLLQIENLKPIDKARMLYRHMYFSSLDSNYLDEIYFEKRYWKIINHKNFNPRIIEYILDIERVENAKLLKDKYFTYIEEKLDNPDDIWGDYFEQLDKPTKALILLVAFNNGRIGGRKLKNSFEAYCEMNGLSSMEAASFMHVIKIALGSLLCRNKLYNDEFEYILFNPSLGDYIVENYFKNGISEIRKILLALSNVTSIEYLQSLKSNKYITNSEFKNLQKNLFNTLAKEKRAEEDWDWLIYLIYSDINNIDHEIVVDILNDLLTLSKEKAREIILTDFYKLYFILSDFESEVVPKKFDFVLAYLNNDSGINDFESLFKYFNEVDINDDELLERLAELYSDHISESIEDHLDIDYTKYVDVIGPDEYEVDTFGIRDEIEETIESDFLNSDINDVLNKTHFSVDSLVDRVSDSHEENALEMFKSDVRDIHEEDRNRDIFADNSKEEIDDLFKKD